MKILQLVVCLVVASLPTVAQTPSQKNETKRPCVSVSLFEQVSGMPKDKFQLTMYDLNRDARRWKQTLGQIKPELRNGDFILDLQIQELLKTASESLADIEKGTTAILKAPKVSEVIAVTFDLSRLHEDVVNISGSTVMANNSTEEVAAATASPGLRTNAVRWQQIMKDVESEVRLYREGLESYAFHLGQTIDAAMVPTNP